MNTRRKRAILEGSLVSLKEREKMRTSYVRTLFVRNWRVLALRSLIAIPLVLTVFVWSGLALAVLLGLFGAFALINGLFALLPPQEPAGTVAGVITLLWPVIRVLAFLYLAAVLAMVTGLLEIVASIRIRHVIGHGWSLLLDGIVSVLLGLILVMWPATSASAILWLFGAYAVISCVLLLFFAFRLRGLLIAREKV